MRTAGLQVSQASLYSLWVACMEAGDESRAWSALEIKRAKELGFSSQASDVVKYLFANHSRPEKIIEPLRELAKGLTVHSNDLLEAQVALGYWKRGDFARFRQAFQAIRMEAIREL